MRTWIVVYCELRSRAILRLLLEYPAFGSRKYITRQVLKDFGDWYVTRMWIDDVQRCGLVCYQGVDFCVTRVWIGVLS